MKKLPLLCALYFVFCTSTALAYTQADVSNAQFLADQWVIVKQSTTAGYRLDNTITRAELVGIALKLKWVTLPSYQCKWYFTDVRNNDWICRATEIAADNGFVTRANTKFRPQNSITRAEALAIIMKSGGLDPNWFIGDGGGAQIDSDTMWHRHTFLNAKIHKIVFPEKTIDSYDDAWPYSIFTFRPHSYATRAEVFGFVRNILNVWTETGEHCEVGGVKVKEPCDVIGNKITFWNHLELEIGYSGPECRISYTYGSVQHNYAFYWTPSLTDFYVQSWKIDAIDVSYDFPGSIIMGEKWHYTLYWARDKCGESITFYDARKVRNSDILAIYYANLDNNFYDFAYLIRFPAGVSRETFESWYKNVTNVTFREDTLKNLWDNTYEFLVDMTENGIKSTYKVKSKVDLENFKINNLSSVKQ